MKKYDRVGISGRRKPASGSSVKRFWQSIGGTGVVVTLLVVAPHCAKAFNLYNGEETGNGLEINLQTTVSYSGFYRVNDPSAILAGPTDANGNDGDSNFRHGVVGNQFEVLPVLDIRDGDFGVHVSGEAFINTVYLNKNQNDQPGTFNSIFNSSNRDFGFGTRNVNGQNAKLLDAFVVGGHTFTDGQSASLKVGRQTLFWGQSLFFANNGISAGQAPLDIITAQSTPNPQSQQVFLPVGQVVATYQPGFDGLTFQGYYQFEWQHDAFQGAGAYFNSADYINASGQTVIVGNVPGLGNEYFRRRKDLSPEHQNGQFGGSVQATFGNYDFGLYALRFDAKAPVVYAFPGVGIKPVPGGLAVGEYQVVYPRDIQIYGGSFSTTIGPANVAGEMSTRRNMPLLPSGFGIPTAANPGNANSDPLYPVGNTLMGQASAIYVSPAVPLDPGGISFDAEIAMNHLLSVTSNRAALRPNGQATAAAFEVLMTPSYYDVLPNFQLTFPIGINYNFLGRSEIDQSMQHGTATFDFGITGTYRSDYIVSLTYQDYLGKPTTASDNTTYNGLADRGYLALNLQHTF